MAQVDQPLEDQFFPTSFLKTKTSNNQNPQIKLVLLKDLQYIAKFSKLN